MSAPLVSVLVVTGRAACRPWLRWNLERLQYPNLEIVVVDSAEGAEPLGHLPWPTTSVQASNRMSCGELRNIALRLARGTYFVWIDDDDWQHPARIRWLVEAAESTDEPWAGWTGGWLYNPEKRGVARLRGGRYTIAPAATIFRTAMVQDVDFDSGTYASDGRWIRNLRARFGTMGEILKDDRPHALWTRHKGNLTPTLRGASYPIPVGDFALRVGARDWGDTDAKLAELHKALSV